MGELRIYVARDSRGQVFAADKVRLEALGLDEEKLLEVFGERGRWEILTLAPSSYSNYNAIESACKMLKEGAFTRDESLLPGARAKIMVTAWTLTDEGGSPIPAGDLDSVSTTVVALINQGIERYMFPDLVDTDFFAPWRELQTRSEKTE